MIVSPVLPSALSGNGQTALRWRDLLSPTRRVRVVQQWPDANASGDDCMLALHARRSADAISAWSQARGASGLAVVLTGTDLYGDIATDAAAQRSLALAQQLIVLQELGVQALPAALQAKARVIFQSTSHRKPLAKTLSMLRAVMVGNLRSVKSPETLMEAAARLRERTDIQLTHIGEASEPAWAERAHATQRDCPNYRWLGRISHGRTRQAIQRAHVLIIASAMEGGAHVIMEAVCSGTPVLASRVDGNVGMLGRDYEGYFAHGDAARLGALLERCRQSQRGPQGSAAEPPLLTRLRTQCDLRAPLFAPERERAALLQLLDDLQDPR